MKIYTDIRQTPNYANYLRSIGWIVEKKDGINYFIRKFSLIGSVIKIQRPEVISYKAIKLLGDKYRAFQIIIEPKDKYQVSGIKYHGFKTSQKPYLPTKTLILDLTKSEETLLKEMKKDARRAIRNARCEIRDTKNKKPLTCCLSPVTDVNSFRDSWKKSVNFRRYVPPVSHLVVLKKAFGQNCPLYRWSSLPVQKSEVGLPRRSSERTQAGAIFLKTDKVAYYWQAFSNNEARKAQVQYKVVWEGIRWAKKMGSRIFDFEGIYDERFPNKSWLGFTHFKKSFGGTEIEYPGAFVKIRLPF